MQPPRYSWPPTFLIRIVRNEPLNHVAEQVASLASRHGQFTVRAAFFSSVYFRRRSYLYALQSCRRTSLETAAGQIHEQ
jgi:hypothetical protein